jgi:hypothetical protein
VCFLTLTLTVALPADVERRLGSWHAPSCHIGPTGPAVAPEPTAPSACGGEADAAVQLGMDVPMGELWDDAGADEGHVDPTDPMPDGLAALSLKDNAGNGAVDIKEGGVARGINAAEPAAPAFNGMQSMWEVCTKARVNLEAAHTQAYFDHVVNANRNVCAAKNCRRSCWFPYLEVGTHHRICIAEQRACSWFCPLCTCTITRTIRLPHSIAACAARARPTGARISHLGLGTACSHTGRGAGLHSQRDNTPRTKVTAP